MALALSLLGGVSAQLLIGNIQHVLARTSPEAHENFAMAQIEVTQIEVIPVSPLPDNGGTEAQRWYTSKKPTGKLSVL
jgi:hypothetical protein